MEETPFGSLGFARLAVMGTDSEGMQPFQREGLSLIHIFSNYLLSETPNITIMVDKDLNIVEFNTAAEKAFRITRKEALEKCLYEIMDSSDFEFVLSSHESISDKKVALKEYGLVTAQNIVYVDVYKRQQLY